MKATTSGRRVWALKWERDEGAAVVFIASSRKGAFEWVRRKFQPQLGPPSERNVLLIIPAYVDHDLTGRAVVTARRESGGRVVFRDWAKDGIEVDR